MTKVSEQKTEKVRALVLIGQEMTGTHGAPSTRAAIAEFLWTLPWVEMTITGDWDTLRWENVAPNDVVVCYAGSRRYACTAEQLAGLRKFVERGGGYVPLHFTTANANEEFLSFIGAEFVKHPPHGPFSVHVADSDHPITHGLPTIEIEDECYQSRYFDRDALHVLQTGRHEVGIDGEPSSWVREIGRGRLFYSALGHDARSFAHPGLRELLTRGIRWAARLEPVASSA
ncbi:MAG: ThuA domain-containing protein [Chloroflexi bacterium]|nr:ThuA domain-containing protein [Chloroflexota bacterium]